jgi:hypothetical protein
MAQGLRLELRTLDRSGLLSDVTRTFRENGLLVTRAEVSTKDDMACNVFYVTDMADQPADPRSIESVRQKIGESCLVIKEERSPLLFRKVSTQSLDEANYGMAAGLFHLGSFVKRNLFSLGLIKS